MIYYVNDEEMDELTYKVYTIKKHLLKEYSEEEANEYILEHSEDLNEYAKELGEKDLEFFCMYFLRDTFCPSDDNEARTLSKSHEELFTFLNKQLIKDEFDKSAIEVSRGFAKTTFADLSVSIWNACYAKYKFWIIIGKTGNDAAQFIGNVRKVLDTSIPIKETFGQLIDKKGYIVNASTVEFTSGVCLRAIGSETSVRGINWAGIRPQLIISDDAQNSSDMLTDSSREKKWSTYKEEVENSGDKKVVRRGKLVKAATKFVYIGTPLHMSCVLSRLIRSNDYRHFVRQAILLEENEDVDTKFSNELWKQCRELYFNKKSEDPKKDALSFYEQHKEEMYEGFNILWPEKWDLFEDLFIPYLEDRKSFMQELMCDLKSLGEKWFPRLLTCDKEEAEDNTFIKTVICIDPATQTGVGNDYSVGIVLSETKNHFFYVRDYFVAKLEFNDYCEAVVDLVEKYNKEIDLLAIEKNTYHGADVISIREKISKRKLRMPTIENKIQNKHKAEKIETIVDPIKNGLITICDENEYSFEFINQMQDYDGTGKGNHDDVPDCLAECFIHIKDLQDNKYFYISSYR